MGLIYFILLLGGLVFIHELGHYLAARLVGVTVTKFSLGFGPKIAGFRRGDTEFLLSALPLGGYCKFLGDDPENPPRPGEAKKGFLTTDIWRRTVIVLAGPFFNLLLPLFVFFPIALTETQLQPAIIGTPSVGGPAWQAGLRPGDRLVSIDGQKVDYWYEMVDRVGASPAQPLVFEIDRNGETKKLLVIPRRIQDPTYRQLGFNRTIGRIEAALDRALPVVKVTADSQAAKAGLNDFDALVDIDSKPVRSWGDVEHALAAAAGRTVTLTVSPADAQTGDDGTEPANRRISVTVPADRSAFGISDGSFVIKSVEPGSAAARAGFMAGDRIVTLNGRSFADPGFMLSEMGQAPDREHVFSVDRNGTTVEMKVSLANPDWKEGSAAPQYLAPGFLVRRTTVTPDLIPNERILSHALVQSAERAWDVFMATAASVAALFTGNVSVKQMGGPIMIYDLAANAGRQGLLSFLNVLSWLSVSLGILNLLPIPVLDGGHLVLFGVELVRRRPLTLKERAIWSWVGLVILILIMATVVTNDIARKWGSLSK